MPLARPARVQPSVILHRSSGQRFTASRALSLGQVRERALRRWDTSEHEWLEGRGELRYLVTMIDATSRVFARFVRHDSTAENMAVLEQYLGRFGRPLHLSIRHRSLIENY
jgi:hypothetical protein